MKQFSVKCQGARGVCGRSYYIEGAAYLGAGERNVQSASVGEEPPHIPTGVAAHHGNQYHVLVAPLGIVRATV